MSTENANRVMLEGFKSFVDDMIADEYVEINLSLDKNEVFWLRQLVWREMEKRNVPTTEPMCCYDLFLCDLHQTLCDEGAQYED